MKVLVFGATGMLGHKLLQRLSLDCDCWGTVREARPPAALLTIAPKARIVCGVDARDAASLMRAVEDCSPDIIVNAVGIVKPLCLPSRTEQVVMINSVLPHRLADIAQARGCALLHFSTDCVFSGKEGAYSEEATPDPVDLYGLSKWAGEVSGPRIVTLRTSIIGRELTNSYGLLEWFCDQEGKTVRGYRNAVFSGFTTQALAGLVRRVIGQLGEISGVTHLASAPISKYCLLTKLRSALSLDVGIELCESEKCDRSLTMSRAYRALTDLPSWDAMVQDLAGDVTPYDALRRENGVHE